MTDWKELPKERHHEVFDLIERGCDVETQGSDYGWHKVKAHRVDGALVFDNNVGLGMVPNRQFRYREPEPEWHPLGVPTAYEIARLLGDGYRVQVSTIAGDWDDVWVTVAGIVCYNNVYNVVPLRRDDKWRCSK